MVVYRYKNPSGRVCVVLASSLRLHGVKICVFACLCVYFDQFALNSYMYTSVANNRLCCIGVFFFGGGKGFVAATNVRNGVCFLNCEHDR